MFTKVIKVLFPLSLLLLICTTTIRSQELTEDEYYALGKQLCCYKDASGKSIDFTKDTYTVFLSDKMDINYTSPENIFTYEQKVDTMFFMNSVKLTKFLEALVFTLNQNHYKQFKDLLANVVLHYNGHKIEFKYRTHKQDFEIKQIDDGKINFINWSEGFVLKTRGFKEFMHSIME